LKANPKEEITMTDNNQNTFHDAAVERNARMTDSQRYEADAIVGILHREIHKTGKYADRLDHYAHAFALGQPFKQDRADYVLRDRYEVTYGQSLKKTQDNLFEREAIMRESGHEQTLHHAHTVETMIQDGDTMPFYLAFDRAAVEMARKHDITEAGAKSMMKEAYARETGRDLYEVGKELEREFHMPRREKARRAEGAAQEQSRKLAPTMQL
jgi:hypothetical protein